MKKLKDLTNEELERYYNHKSYDTKMAYHPLRLLDQLNQLLDEGTIDLMNNNQECKAMRKGEWGDWKKFERVMGERLEAIEKKALTQNAISPKPRLGELKQLLADSIEEWYGSEAGMQKQATEYVSVNQLWEKFEALERKMDVKLIQQTWDRLDRIESLLKEM